ncbi:glycoside hydrolase family 75 protein, partial [bacterium]|nr:glycoside hydrolase family 75 protein [bacterium]
LPKILNDFDKLVESAEVSPFYHHLYELKTQRIQQKVTRIDQLLSRHNLYDTETVLQIKHPESGQKLLLVQGEMDVVSDGSDGDRWPELDDYITMSQYYQPFTSYGWGKRTSNPNPLLARWKENLKKYEEEFAIEGLSIERNRFLRQQIETLGPEIADMEARSYLIAEADPFFVLPLSFLGRRDENEFGPAIGDYGVIIYENQIFPVIAGDAGPSWKFGEASLRVAKTLNEKASPYNRPVSDLKVTYLIFPGSADETKGPPDLEAWHAKCSELLNGVGGISENYQLHQWEDLIAKKKAEREAKKAAKEKAAESEAEEDAPNSQPQPGQ